MSAPVTVAVPADATTGLPSVHPVDPDRDAALVQRWLGHPASSWWAMTDHDVDAVRAYLRSCRRTRRRPAGCSAGREPIAYAETYDPRSVLLTDVWDAEPGDVGMHLLVAPPPADGRVHGLTSAVVRAVVEHCRDALGARRVVVEPDVRNTAVQRKNAEVGFRALREVDVDGKRALLSVLDTERIGSPTTTGPQHTCGPSTWSRPNGTSSRRRSPSSRTSGSSHRARTGTRGRSTRGTRPTGSAPGCTPSSTGWSTRRP